MMWYYAQVDLQRCMQAIFEIVNTLHPMDYIFHDTKEQVEPDYVRIMAGQKSVYSGDELLAELVLVKPESLPPIFDALGYH